ncbi:kinase-like domain-containing protein [Rhizophagus irregularis DAOM 181602=DAOM 197198]|uniref:Protein kinase domain-containing protein n=2 Tax=Rhizophagus irregularis TaxID=588596 RepID=A0A015KU88_RHIIW|nr:hypothetical protein GLOIN_2v1771596 [Rhizophagus irregularis DAOM 181602=DAOM 197198]EXX63516.1 hypothetical protein RirG_151830 [Rhizophagus irregularis DAOM 197198w]POG74170.1 hypothetical protein GLOIN_2v1771596 [Rhizophagus irregularis DAOM 181602=DAOM 197198]GBC24040.1 kinase-like domain-containing protein [Rhizophagus irregularis DAOM 181602=DAOM 197198]|eukprot:XP_025181036.1 hypothetical protein GLOIN_2v1771596 [Rhizophagus irregularis DAOM 181602=DAOM 197198]
MSSDPSFEEVKEYNIEQLITYLRTKILNFEENDFAIFRNQRINGQTIVNMTQKGFSEPPFNFVYGIAKNLSNLIDELKSQRSLSLNEILSYILPPIKYPPYASTSISSTKVSGDWPIKIMRWKEFKSEANEYNFVGQEKFERPYLIENLKAIVKSNVETAMEVNIFHILNTVLKKYKFEKQNDLDFLKDTYISPFKPDYTCYLKTINNLLKQILAIEIRRYIVIEGFENFDDEDLKRQSFSRPLHDVIEQLYNYMSVLELQYGILSSYDYHWFFYRPKNNNTELYISHPLKHDSTDPPVLKAYAYLALLAERDPKSPHHNIINHNKRQNSRIQNLLLQNSENIQISRSIGSSYYSSNAISMFFGHWKTWQQDYNKITEQDFDFSEFKFKSFLGCGQTGGTYACEFYGQIIALKVLNLYKNSQFLNQMQKEIEIYKLLFKIQEIYIPKLVCYGYYEIGYVMGITIVGTKLSFHKIEQWQKNKALRALEIIHSHNILHNDIREENILINEKNNIYIIDFGKSIKTDKKNLFCKEKSELSHLLNYYM